MSALLTQLSTVKSRLGIPEHDVADDTELSAFIAFVSGRFAEECRRDFDRQENVTQEFEGDVTELVMNRFPIESVSAFDLKEDEDDGWVAQSDVSYILKASSRGIKCIVSLDAPLGTWRERLRVTYTGGYVLPGTEAGAGQTALPEALDKACVEQVAYWWQRRKQLGLLSVSGEGGTIQQFTKMDLLPHVEALLKQHELFRL